jgi:flagella basal body P-ring formation protein FlgA
MARISRGFAAAMAAAMAGGLAVAAGVGVAYQDVAQIEAAARDEAARALPPLTAHQRLQIGPLSQHSQLPRCDQEIRASVAPGPKMRDRILVELRCQGPVNWHLYIPVRILGTTAAVIAARSLVAGTVLTAKDVTLEQRDLGQTPPGYFDDAAAVLGLTAARSIPGGAILINQQLLGNRAIQRGQTVTLIADTGGMSVRMAGRALADGMVNQRIRVENLSSGKVVEGIARSAQVVEIVLQ